MTSRSTDPTAVLPPAPILAEVLRHLEAACPQEGCGVILRAGQGDTWRVRPLRNVAPTPRVAYAFDASEWLRVCREADTHDERVAWVFHSHVDAPATFSAEDRARAAPDGVPLLPGVSYLVVAIHRGCVTEVSQYAWSSGEFRRIPVSLADFRIEKPLQGQALACPSPPPAERCVWIVK